MKCRWLCARHGPKQAFKTLMSQKLMEVKSWFCACNFISIKATNWPSNFRWAWADMPRHVQRGFWNLYISKTVGVPKLIFGLLPLGKKESYEITVSISLGKHFSPKWLIGFFWNSTWSWSDWKVKNWQSQISWKKPHCGNNSQK